MKFSEIKKQADQIKELEDIHEIAETFKYGSLAYLIAGYGLEEKGFYSCRIDGVKTLFILSSKK